MFIPKNSQRDIVSRDFSKMRDISFISFYVGRPLLAAGDSRKMRCENSKKSHARRMAARERERVFFPRDGIRCSISGVVGAVIVEDRLLSFSLSPRSSLPSDGSLRPTSLVSSQTSSTLAPKCPLRKPPRRQRISLPKNPHSLTFPTTWHPPFSTVSGVIGCPSSLSLSPTAQACGSSKGACGHRSRTVHGDRASRRVGLLARSTCANRDPIE